MNLIWGSNVPLTWKKLLGCWVILVFAFTSQSSYSQTNTKTDFNRKVRPILAAKCFACHGPDEKSREADLRLDIRESALDSDAFVPGDSDASELVTRILANDDSVMPPAESGESLTKLEKETLIRWISEGAKYDEHWAFVPPKQKPLPLIETDDPELRDWITNPIDKFVLNRLIKQGLRPSQRADRYSLVRRLYLDLTGLPPTPEQADKFFKNPNPSAYEDLVDELLSSKSYGEKWARQWLDLARYADTNGYEKDRVRSIWPYRDWVIRAINNDMPFDQFTIEQLAGDMLPEATNAQRIATGFHRNTMLNEEGGIDPLEYRFYAMVDRVATTGTVWLGLTTGCAQCHTHKYDPITHTDYFRLMALMNNADEPDLAVNRPELVQARATVLKKIAQAEQRLRDQFIKNERQKTKNQSLTAAAILNQSVNQWLKSKSTVATNWNLIRPTSFQTNLPKLDVLPDGSLFASGDFTKRDVYQLSFEFQKEQEIKAIRLEVLPDPRLPAGGPGNAYYEGRKGDFFLSEFKARLDDEPLEFDKASTSYGKISIGSGKANGENVFDGEGSTGWSTSGQEGKRNTLVLNLKSRKKGKQLKIELLFERHFVASLGRFRISITNDNNATANQIPDSIEREMANWSKDQAPSAETTRQFLLTTPKLANERKQLDQLRKQLPKLPQTMVMQERSVDHTRPTFRYHRGEYLSPREQVDPQLPSLFPPFPDNITPNRLSFAKWLVSESNPLAARVTVNRDWQSFFGRGLVDSAGDFGTQSPPPSHPDLLDWLAIYFQKNNWSRKKLHRLIVLSSTYRQASNVGAESFGKDPQNELLSRGPRFRVNAEVVRDILLTASGKLSSKMYGPSVYPPQPASVTALAYGNTRWPASKGEDRYRRSLYTFSKRTAPFAAYQTFNSPTGENCIAKRDRSNTPLQALTILNDEMFVELARALAKLAVDSANQQETPAELNNVAAFIFRRLLTRPPTEQELKQISDFYHRQLMRIKGGELNADQIGGPSTSHEVAGWILVARALASLDEVITKP